MKTELQYRNFDDLMNSVTLKHVMANCEKNLYNTHSAILKLANGNIVELEELVKCAKNDFRDVILWASLK